MNTTRKFIQHDYGVTKDPKADKFVIVTKYVNDGSLKNFLIMIGSGN